MSEIVSIARFAHLRNEAELRWRKRCPCCRNPMSYRADPQGRTPRDYRTVGHDVPQSLGGDEDRWIYICRGCNQDQGSMTFATWARWLRSKGDQRWMCVTEVAEFFERHA